jgi:nitrate/nitrite transporter NarK
MIGMGAGLGTYVSSSSYFIKPLQAEFGWSRGQVSLTTSTGLLINSLALPLMGVLIDRYGPRAFILVGSVLSPWPISPCLRCPANSSSTSASLS